MLDISKIAITEAYGEVWRKARYGKITASPAGKLISEESDKGKFTKGAQSYIDGLAGEYVTQTPAKQEFFTDATNRGNSMEGEAVIHFCESNGKTVLRDVDRGDTHRLIIVDEFIACTPDALICLADEKNLFDETKTKIKVAPLEVKCPMVLSEFIKLYKCDSPDDLKKANPLYFWQALAQLIWCNSLIGYWGVYHPDFPVKMKVITFKKSELITDIKFLNNTVAHAKNEIKKTIQLFSKS